MANRLPVLLLAGDTFQSRLPDPVLQQVEHFGDPSTTANDAFRPVVRYWDRITRPEQVVQSCRKRWPRCSTRPTAAGVPRPAPGRAGRGLRLPGAPLRARRPRHPPPAPGPGRARAAAAATAGTASADRRRWRRPLLPRRSRAGRVRRAPRHPRRGDRRRQVVASPRTTRSSPVPSVSSACEAANRLAAEADVVVAVGTRLQDFTTGSWTCSATRAALVGINAARFDAGSTCPSRSSAMPEESLIDRRAARGLACPPAWTARVATRWPATGATSTAWRPRRSERPTYAQVVGAVSRERRPTTTR